MNQQNREKFSLKNKKQLKGKTKSQYRKQNRLKLIINDQFGYLTSIVLILTLFITIITPAHLAVSQPLIDNLVENHPNQVLFLAQEELEEETSTEELEEETSTEELEEEASTEELEEEASTEESEEEASAEESEEEASAEESEEEASTEESEEEASSEESEESELSFEEAKKVLEEEMDERFEEWESKKRGSQISHSFSAITTIVLTILITLLGTGLFQIPFGRMVILIMGIIAVLIQFHASVFLLEKSLGGYEILKEQGSIFQNRLESVKTEEELVEIEEQFQELILESVDLE